MCNTVNAPDNRLFNHQACRYKVRTATNETTDRQEAKELKGIREDPNCNEK